MGVKAFSYRRVKNDEKDAADLADLLRMGRLPEAWIAPPEVRELRELTRCRIKLVSQRTSAKDQVHGVLAKLGVPVTCSDIFGVWGNSWLDGLALPQPYAGKVASLRKLAGELSTEIALLDLVIADLLSGHDGYHALQVLPGIGPVLAAVICAEIGDIRRFSCPARLCSWAGLTPAIVSPISRWPAGISPNRAPRCCGGRWWKPSTASPPPAPSAPSRTASSPVAARKPKNIAKTAAAPSPAHGRVLCDA